MPDAAAAMKHLEPPIYLVDRWIDEASGLAYLRDQFQYVARCAALWGNRPADRWTSVELLGLEAELLNPLVRANIRTIEQIRQLGPAELMKVRTLGPERVGRILAAINRYERDHS